MSLGGNFGKPLFGSQTTSAASFGSATPTFGGPSPFATSQSAPSFGSSPNVFQGGSVFGGGGTPSSVTPQAGFGVPPSGAAPSSVPPSPFGQAQPAFGNAVTNVNPGQPAFSQHTPSFFGSGSNFGNSQAVFASSTPFPASSFNQPSFAGGANSLGGFGSVGLGTQTTQSVPTFGNSSVAFGAKSVQSTIPLSTSAFGNTLPNVSTSLGQGSAQGNTLKGTGNPKFQPIQEYDGGGVNVKYMSISRMPDYQDKSFEELRYEDYLLGKKNSSSLSTFQPVGSGFGTSSINTGFGGPSSSLFASSPAISTPGFGASTSSLFGNTSTAFGSSQPSSVPGFGLGSSPFGQTSTGFGSSSSVFGVSTPVPAFGSQSGAPFQAATTFGSSSSSSSLFSSNSSQKPFSGFGTSMPNQQLGSFGSTSIFGNTSTAPAFGGSFGNTSAPSQPTLNLGSFGSSFGGGNRFGSASSSSASFGSSTFASSSPFANSFAFGADSSKQSGSLFGGGFATSPQTTSALFGSLPAASSGTSLFGSFSSSNPTTNILSPMGQQSNTGGFAAPALGISGVGNSFSGLQSSSSGLFGSTPTFSAPFQQSSSFSMGSAPLFGTQNSSILPNNLQGQQNWSFATSQSVAFNDMNTPYGKSPIFEAASLSLGKSSGTNNSLESTNSSTSLSFSNGSSIARPSARSFARIHARSLRSSLSLSSPLFETKKPVSVFSPEHFTLVEADGSSPLLKSPAIGRSDMKRLIITPRSDVKGDISNGEWRNFASGWKSPPERKLSFPSSSPTVQSSEELEKTNGLISSPTERKTTDLLEQSHVAKPTPLRSPGQYSGNLRSPSVYSSYREFYEEHLSPEASRLESVSKMDERSSAPILTKPTYFTSPSIEKLRRMGDEDLSHVFHFTVGRRDIGEIQWYGETDVRNLDLDRLVIIENREVTVYPNESEKPEVGIGLNKPAKVSLHKVWKMDKKTGQPLKDVASVTNFTAKLKSHCEKQGLTFLGYDATQGTWSFEVPHFSRYGLPDSEDESSEEEVVLESSLGHTSASLNLVFDKEIERIHEDEAEDEFPTVERMNIKESVDEKVGTSKESQMDLNTFIHSKDGKKWTSSRMLLSSRKNPFKSNIFSAELGKTPEQQFFSSNSKMEESQPNKQHFDLRNVIQKSPSSMKTSPEQVPGWLNAESFKDEIEEPMQKGSTKNRKFTRRFLELCFRVSLNNSFLYTETEMKGKPLSFLSRSFRASVGPGFQVAFPIPSFMESNRPFISPVFIHEQAEEWEHSFIQKTLRIHFSSWKLSFDTEEMNDSFVYRRPSFRFPFRHREVVMKTLQHLILEAGFSGNQHFELVLRLLLVLFVQNIDLDQDTRTSHDIELLLFRRHLSGWLQNFACTWSQEERNPAQDQFLYIFHLLTRGEIEQAVKFCSETKNFRLACMVAKGMQLQDEGYRSSCLKIHRFYCGHVPKDLDRIYALLSGDILHATENLSLSWYRTFGLHFWYGSGALVTDSDGLKCSLQSYIDEWQSNEFVAPPVPPHIVITVPEHEQLEASKGLKSDSLIYDACYVLLCIAADLYPEHVQWMHLATPLAYGVVYDALDAHKPWLVCEILSSICATSYLEPKVIISFAIQLEMMHLYTWAFYVLWSCEVFGNNNMFYLKNVFIHWFPWIIVEEVEGTDGKLSSDRFLREELGVPASWFEEAACIYSRYNFQFIEEVDHLCVLLHMEADEYPLFSCVHLANRAHQVVLGRAAPSVFVLDTSSVQWRKLKKILSVLGAIDRDYPGMIRDYKNGGSILEGICSIIQGFRLSLEDLESLLKNMELFSSLVSNLGCSKQGDMTLELFITCIFSHVFRETWKQLMEDTDDSKFQRLASCLETLQYSSHVPWSCKQFIHNFIETYRSSGISFTRELSTRSYFQLFDLWFPRKLVE